jgi:predicted nucleic acid-binding Zn ribbon protein
MTRCLRCGRPLSKRVRGDAKYCSARCRTAHWQNGGARARNCAVCRKRLPLGQRIGARFCSAACRQRAYRRREAAAVPSKASLRLIKERHAAADGCCLLPPDIGNAIVRPVPRRQPRKPAEPPG